MYCMSKFQIISYWASCMFRKLCNNYKKKFCTCNQSKTSFKRITL